MTRRRHAKLVTWLYARLSCEGTRRVVDMDIMIQRSVRGGHAVARDRQFLDETGDGATRHSRLVRMTKSLAELMAPDWAAALAGQEAQIHAMGEFLRSELAAGRGYLPAGDLVLRAFSQPLEDVRVLIVGQDPYPTVGHPIGLSFAVNADVRPLPGSLVNIYRELEADLGVPPCPHGDLSAWAAQGVLLLNRCLTVQPSKPASHRGQGWEQVTQAAIDALIARGGPLVAILWGRDAATVRPQLDAANVPVIVSAHPSPLSARNGFYGSRPFSRANAALAAQGASPINWALA